MSGGTTAEIRHATRSLWRSPTVAFCAVLCLALGIGATTAMFSALSRALLTPLPFHEPDQLVAVHRITPQSGPLGGWSQSAPNYMDLSRRSGQIESLAAITWGSALINLPSDAIQATQHLVTGNLFQTLGARPQLGRLLGPDDDRADAEMVAVLGDDIWRARFNAEPGIVGRTVTINGQPTTIVGIAPRDFRIPLGGRVLKAEVWTPIRFTPTQLAARRSNNLLTLGRLAPGASVQSAEAELRAIFASLIQEYPQLKGDNLRVAALHAENIDKVRKPLLLVFGAVLLVLLIAVANVAALLLARGVQRQREMAVRSALGGKGWSLLRPLFVESLIISLVGVSLGVAIALVAVKTIGVLAATQLAQLEGLRVEPTALAFALSLSIIVAMLCGAIPAWRASRIEPQEALRGGRGVGAGREQHRALASLVVLQISLSMVLLIGGGLVLQALARLLEKDPGFETAGILTLGVTASPARYPNQTGVQNFLEPVLARIEAVPGVEAAGTISAVPYQTWGNTSSIRYDGMPKDDPATMPLVEQRGVSPGYFLVTRQRLISGRLLRDSDGDLPGASRVVVVNEALMKRDFRGQDPVGKRYHVTDTTFGTIVGVVSNVRNNGPFGDPQPEMYHSYRQWSPASTTFSLLIRVRSGDPAAWVPAIRLAVRAVDPTAAVARTATMDQLIARSLGAPRFYVSILGSVAAIALILAMAGLYGVLSYAVAQRTREIGIRSALGSSRTALIRLFMTSGLKLAAVGVILGLAGGAAITRTMQSLLYGISPLDVRTWALATLVMLLSALTAALVPARRAANVDPLIAIRTE
jgi:putative ABC transport system permease protein